MQEVRKNSRAYEIYKEYRRKHPLPVEEEPKKKEERRMKLIRFDDFDEDDTIDGIDKE